jgi:hypothetical protein
VIPIATLAAIALIGGTSILTDSGDARAVATSARADMPPIRVWVNGDGSSAISGGRAQVYFQSEADAYVTVLALDGRGMMRVVYPRSPRDTARVWAGRTYSVPVAFGISLVSLSSSTVEYALAIASDHPFNYTRYKMGGSWRMEPAHYQRPFYDPIPAIQQFVDDAIPDPATDFSYDYATYRVHQSGYVSALGRRYAYGSLYHCLTTGAVGLYSPYWFSVFNSISPFAWGYDFDFGNRGFGYGSALNGVCSPARTRYPRYVYGPQAGRPVRPTTPSNPIDSSNQTVRLPGGKLPGKDTTAQKPVIRRPFAPQGWIESGNVIEQPSHFIEREPQTPGGWQNPRVPRSRDLGEQKVADGAEKADREPAARAEPKTDGRRISVELLRGGDLGMSAPGAQGRIRNIGGDEMAERMRAEPQPRRDTESAIYRANVDRRERLAELQQERRSGSSQSDASDRSVNRTREREQSAPARTEPRSEPVQRTEPVRRDPPPPREQPVRESPPPRQDPPQRGEPSAPTKPPA